MKKKGIKISGMDTVITVAEQVSRLDEIVYEENGKEAAIAAVEDIPQYHKAACADMLKDSDVIKYGMSIGVAIKDIKKGEHVHIHNLQSRCMAEVTEK